jgi:MerR family mercuric resistance operon transcriptional regulator
MRLKMEELTIGALAKEAEVNVETVRYYERRSLIDQPRKPHSGFRHYPPDLIDRIRFIKRAQELGFTLEEITELLALRVEPATACDEVKQQAEGKIADIAEKIKTLQRMKKTLTGLVNACDKRTSTTECPILEALK